MAALGRRLAVLLACAWLFSGLGRAVASEDRLVIETAAGEALSFTVELVDTPAERSKGLMYRRELAAMHGMLFDFHQDQRVAFWMKNTYIPLDMLFITSGGVIAHIHERATPHSTQSIPSPVPVQAVFEIYGGESERLGIAAGDRVVHPIFDP